MPLIPTVINSAMDAAFMEGFKVALKTMASLSDGSAGTKDLNPDKVIDAGATAGAAAFTAIAGPAITACIKAAQVLPGQVVTTAGTAVAQTGATTTPGVLA